MKVLQLLVSWGSTWSYQALTKEGLGKCFIRQEQTTTYDSHHRHSQVFQGKTDQSKQVNQHIQIVRILQAEEHQGQYFFIILHSSVWNSADFLMEAHLHISRWVITCWRYWKDIWTYYLPASILHAQINDLLAYSHFETDPVSAEIDRKLPLASPGKHSCSLLVRLNTLWASLLI